jgi:hypothetical protein
MLLLLRGHIIQQSLHLAVFLFSHFHADNPGNIVEIHVTFLQTFAIEAKKGIMVIKL